MIYTPFFYIGNRKAGPRVRPTEFHNNAFSGKRPKSLCAGSMGLPETDRFSELPKRPLKTGQIPAVTDSSQCFPQATASPMAIFI